MFVLWIVAFIAKEGFMDIRLMYMTCIVCVLLVRSKSTQHLCFSVVCLHSKHESDGCEWAY